MYNNSRISSKTIFKQNTNVNVISGISADSYDQAGHKLGQRFQEIKSGTKERKLDEKV